MINVLRLETTLCGLSWFVYKKRFAAMASAEPQPRFGQSVKGLLSDKVGSCSGDVIALTRQVLKGSRSQEVKLEIGLHLIVRPCCNWLASWLPNDGS